MRLLALVFIAEISYCNVQAIAVEELIKEAKEHGAPFSQSSIEKIKPEGQWGAKGAERSTDVVIFNPTSWSFALGGSNCTSGCYTDGLSPERRLKEFSSTVFRIQSTQPKTGVQCSLRYFVSVMIWLPKWFSVQINSPYGNGESNVSYKSSRVGPVNVTSEQGNNNQIRITIGNRHLALSQQSGRSSHQKKGKGAHNTFIKASKSGSSIRTI